MTNAKLIGPYRFKDTTDYQRGWSMGTQAEVLAFFRQKSHLLDPEEWGNAYQAGLTDGNGTPCWVERGARGGLKVVAAEED